MPQCKFDSGLVVQSFIKAFGEDGANLSKADLKNLEIDLNGKDIGLLGQFKKEIDEANVDKLFKSFDEAKLNDSVKRSMINLVQKYKSINTEVGIFKTLLGSGKATVQKVKAAIVKYAKGIESHLEASRVSFENKADEYFGNMATGGNTDKADDIRKAKRAYQMFRAGKEEQVFKEMRMEGIEQPEIVLGLAMKGHNLQKISELISAEVTSDYIRILGSTFKQLRSDVVKDIQLKAPFMGIIDDYIMPIKVVSNKFARLQFPEFDTMFRKTFDLDKMDIAPEKVDKFITDQFERMRTESLSQETGNFLKPENVFAHRRLVFKSDIAEVDFLSKYGDTGDGFMVGALRAMSSTVKRAALYNKIGPDAEGVLNAQLRYALGLLPESDKFGMNELTAISNKYHRSLAARIGENPATHRPMDVVSENVADIISSRLTGAAAIRNYTFDNFINRSLVRSAQTGDSALYSIAKVMNDMFHYSVKNGRSAMLSDIFEKQGILMKLSSHSLIADVNRQVAAQGAVSRFNRWTAETTSKISLADWELNQARVAASVDVSRTLFKHLDKNLKELPNFVQKQFEMNGIDEPMFKLMKKLDVIELDGEKVMVDLRKISEMSDADVSSIRGSLETGKDARNRFERSVNGYFTMLVDQQIAKTNIEGSILADIGLSDATKSPIVSTIFKFYNITHAQWMNLMSAQAIRMGLDPAAVGRTGVTTEFLQAVLSTKEGYKFLGRWALYNVIGGYTMLWMQDIKNGKTPRAISMEATGDALFQTGAMGAIGSFIQGQFFSEGVIGTPLDKFKKAGKHIATGVDALSRTGDPASLGRATSKAVDTFLPFTNMWYTKAATQALVKEAFEVELSNFSKQLNKEMGQRSMIHQDWEWEHLNPFKTGIEEPESNRRRYR